jgi:hypothetical protein
VITLTFLGSAEASSVDQLEQQLAEVHRSAVAGQTRSVVVDLRDLEFASSSCLKAIATWLHLIDQLAEQRYSVRFRSNPAYSWQRRSLGALAAFAPDIVEIEADAA